MDFTQSLLVALFCMSVVFAVLFIIMGITYFSSFVIRSLEKAIKK